MKITGFVVLLIALVVGIAYFVQVREDKIADTGEYSGLATEENPAPLKQTVLKTSNDTASGISFEYPETFNTTYIDPIDWPPAIRRIPEAYTCTEAGDEGSGAGKTERRTINGTEYCVTTIIEGAAGSMYGQYAYATEKEGRHIILTFSTRTPQCGNYPDREKNECESERESFDIDQIIDSIVRSVKFGGG